MEPPAPAPRARAETQPHEESQDVLPPLGTSSFPRARLHTPCLSQPCRTGQFRVFSADGEKEVAGLLSQGHAGSSVSRGARGPSGAVCATCSRYTETWSVTCHPQHDASDGRLQSVCGLNPKVAKGF